MPIPLGFQGKFTEKYFKKFHLPKVSFNPKMGDLWTSYLPTYQKLVQQLTPN